MRLLLVEDHVPLADELMASLTRQGYAVDWLADGRDAAVQGASEPYDLIILDEVGFAPLDDTGTQLLFRLVAGAYERRSLAIASHWPFEQWGRFLPEHTTAASILDRLLHHATVVITDGQSYRMKDAQHRKETTPTT